MASEPATSLVTSLSDDVDLAWQPRADSIRTSTAAASGHHASPLLYGMLKAAGIVADEDLMTDYRRVESPWMDHAARTLPSVDVATGSLGHGAGWSWRGGRRPVPRSCGLPRPGARVGLRAEPIGRLIMLRNPDPAGSPRFTPAAHRATKADH
jgi:hypothetical protein